MVPAKKKAAEPKNSNAKSEESLKKAPSQKNSTATAENDKITIIQRNLLRLYQFIAEEKPIAQAELLAELDMDTPNEELRNEIQQLNLEMEALYEENHALRQSALQNQIEGEEQRSAYQIEIDDLQLQLEQIDIEVKEKTKRLTEKYEKRIDQLERELEEAIIQNQKFTKVNEAVQMLQEKAKSLFASNDRLEKVNRNLTTEIEENEQTTRKLQKEFDDLSKKTQALEKKVELQKMVIDGYKRKEKR